MAKRNQRGNEEVIHLHRNPDPGRSQIINIFWLCVDSSFGLWEKQDNRKSPFSIASPHSVIFYSDKRLSNVGSAFIRWCDCLGLPLRKKRLKWPPIFYSCAAQAIESSWISRSRRPRCVSEKHWKPRQLNSKRQRGRMLLMRSLRFFVSLMLVSTLLWHFLFLDIQFMDISRVLFVTRHQGFSERNPLDCVTILTPQRTLPCHFSRAIV